MTEPGVRWHHIWTGWPCVLTLLANAVRYECAAGATSLPDARADLLYAARLLRERAGQQDSRIRAAQSANASSPCHCLTPTHGERAA